jgi:hypothetical protein
MDVEFYHHIPLLVFRDTVARLVNMTMYSISTCRPVVRTHATEEHVRGDVTQQYEGCGKRYFLYSPCRSVIDMISIEFN